MQLFPHQRYYLDYAASTPVSNLVIRAMQPYWSVDFGNPNSIHSSGVKAKKVIDDCQKIVKKLSGVKKDGQVLWTSGGTESNQVGIDNAIKAWKEDNFHMKYSVIVSYAEHASVLNYLDNYNDDLMSVHYVNLDNNGYVDMKDLEKLLRLKNVVLVVAQLQSSEVGATQDLKKIGKVISNNRGNEFPFFHVDASQGLFYNKIDIQSWQASSVAVCGQKINGPKGSGILIYAKNGNGLREGTPAVPLVVGTTKAMEIAQKNIVTNKEKILELRVLLLSEMKMNRVNFQLNGRLIENSLVINISFQDDSRDSEQLIVAFDNTGLEVSSKSACMGSQISNSKTLDSMGLVRTNSIRISLHHDMKSKDIKRIAKIISLIER